MIKYGKAISPECASHARFCVPELTRPACLGAAQQIPKKQFAVMGLLDSIAGIMQSLSVNYLVNGSLIILLMQSAIPVRRPSLLVQHRPHLWSVIADFDGDFARAAQD